MPFATRDLDFAAENHALRHFVPTYRYFIFDTHLLTDSCLNNQLEVALISETVGSKPVRTQIVRTIYNIKTRFSTELLGLRATGKKVTLRGR